MAARPRATFFFNDNRYSWSETHWYTVDGVDLEEVVLPAALALARQRMGLMGTTSFLANENRGPECIAVRLSYDDTFRDSLLDVSLNGQAVLLSKMSVPNGIVPPEVPWSCLFYRMESGLQYRKTMYVSGIPDDVIEDPDGPIFIDRFRNAQKDWVTELTNGKWGFACRSRPPDIVAHPVTNMVAAVDGTITITCPGHALATGDKVALLGVRYLANSPRLRGQFYVDVTDASTLVVRGVKGAIRYRDRGTIEKVVYAVRPYTAVILRGETHRKRGVSPGNSIRGRQRNRT
jgi:hypothetical protein